eukprot:gene5632-7445_t
MTMSNKKDKKSSHDVAGSTVDTVSSNVTEIYGKKKVYDGNDYDNDSDSDGLPRRIGMARRYFYRLRERGSGAGGTDSSTSHIDYSRQFVCNPSCLVNVRYGCPPTSNALSLRHTVTAAGRSQSSSTVTGPHLVVLCHGFQGCAKDMRLLSNMLNAELCHLV